MRSRRRVCPHVPAQAYSDSNEEEERGRRPHEAWDLEEATDVLSDTLGATMRHVMLSEAPPSCWPPVQLTHVTAMTLAVRHVHALLPESEAVLQVRWW